MNRNPFGWLLLITMVVMLVLMAATLAGVSSCSSGYSFSSAYREDVNTIAVPVFENTTFSHGTEFALTEAVIKEIHRVTPWRVINEASAQTTLSGTITGSQLRQLTRQADSGMGQEMAVQLTVSFEWKQNDSGEVLVARRSFRASDSFVPTKPAGERLELGQQSAVERLARDIVRELRSSW
jgi:hypothetical protein